MTKIELMPIKVKMISVLNRFGFDLRRYPTRLLQNRIQLLNANNVGTIFDIGANTGQYALELRKIGFSGQIVSFEPLKGPYGMLMKHSKTDPNWTAVNCAVGDYDGKVMMHVAENSVSSSLLNMTEKHLASAPNSKYVGAEEVSIFKADSLIKKYYSNNTGLFLKIDVQGFEQDVIDGLGDSLDLVSGFQLELSLQEMYEGEKLIDEMITIMRGKGYSPMSIEPGFLDANSGELLQADVIFIRTEILKH